MACANLPNFSNNSGNAVSNIPVKIGAPMSTACQRILSVGSIPVILNYPGFTLVDGAVAAQKISNGGIGNTSAFFKNSNNCFDEVTQYGSTCEQDA